MESVGYKIMQLQNSDGPSLQLLSIQYNQLREALCSIVTHRQQPAIVLSAPCFASRALNCIPQTAYVMRVVASRGLTAMGRCRAPGAFHELWLAHIVLWPAGPHLAPLGVDVQLGQRLLGPIQGGMQRSSSIDIPVPAACSSKTGFSLGLRRAGASVVARWLAAFLKVLRVGCTWCGLGDTGVPKATRLEEWVEGRQGSNPCNLGASCCAGAVGSQPV